MNTSLNGLSVLFALLAAGLWFHSASVRILYVEKKMQNGMIAASATIKENGKWYDVIRTAQRQSWWSAWAAVAAAISAILQGMVWLAQVGH